MRTSNTVQAASCHSASELSLVMSCSPTDLSRGRGACGPIRIHLLLHHAPGNPPGLIFPRPRVVASKSGVSEAGSNSHTPLPTIPEPPRSMRHIKSPLCLSHPRNIWRLYLRNLFVDLISKNN